MEKVYLGKIVATHGIKGELRIKSNFEYKEKAFKVGNVLIIDDKDYIIKTYRQHKTFDMVTLNDFRDINEVEFLLKKNVYIDKMALVLNDDEVLDQDLLEYKTIIGNETYKIVEVFYASKTNKIIRLKSKNKEILVPYQKEFIKKIDKSKRMIYIELLDGMIL